MRLHPPSTAFNHVSLSGEITLTSRRQEQTNDTPLKVAAGGWGGGSQVTPELRSNMAASNAASEVAAKAESSITGHVAPLHHCVQV